MVRVVSTEYMNKYVTDKELYNDLTLDKKALAKLEKQRKKRAIEMSTDYLTLGPAPAEETPAQVGDADYAKRTTAEAKQYIRMLYGILGDQFGGDVVVRLQNKGFPHDFGAYHEVCVIYNPENEQSVEQAFWIESNCPLEWDDEARKALGL